MGYYEVAKMTDDMDFVSRIAACYALETNAADPESWANQKVWRVAAAPSFGDKYTYALNANNPAPGKDPSVISDNEILAVVQQLINEENSQP